MLSGADRPGRSPISTATMAARSAIAMASPIATRPCSATVTGAIRQPSARSAGSTAARTGAACACTAQADKPSEMTKATSQSPSAWFASIAVPSAESRRPRSGRMRYCCRSCTALVTVSTGNPSFARSLTSWVSSSGACTASRARAWASRKSSSGAVASEAPLRASPMRAAVNRRSAAQGSSDGGSLDAELWVPAFAGTTGLLCGGSDSPVMRVTPAAARGMGLAGCAAGCARLCPSTPAAPAKPRTPVRGGDAADRAWRAHRGTRCSDSPA